MRAERKESSAVMMDNTFPSTGTGPFDYVANVIREKTLKWLAGTLRQGGLRHQWIHFGVGVWVLFRLFGSFLQNVH